MGDSHIVVTPYREHGLHASAGGANLRRSYRWPDTAACYTMLDL
jgi:hypothetical protein